MSIFHSPNPLIEADLLNLSIINNPLTMGKKSRRPITLLTKNKKPDHGNASPASNPGHMGIQSNPLFPSGSPVDSINLSMIPEQVNINTPSQVKTPPTALTDSTPP